MGAAAAAGAGGAQLFQTCGVSSQSQRQLRIYSPAGMCVGTRSLSPMVNMKASAAERARVRRRARRLRGGHPRRKLAARRR